MRTRSIVAFALGLAGLALLGGCQGTGMPTADELLAGAQQSLEQNDTKTAGVWLGSAASAVETEQERKELRLLIAEASLREGNPERAASEADALLAAYPDDPRVQELAGKTGIVLGDFVDARVHLERARGGYRSEVDIGRAEDLLALADGLDAYAEGNMSAAYERWRMIGDAALRASVMTAADEVEPADDDDDQLARFE